MTAPRTRTPPVDTPTAAEPVPVVPGPLQRLPTMLRPDRRLLTYYLLTALLTGPAFPVVMALLYFRYQTLRYELDEEGLTMRWGVLFRREVLLTYARIQDIHLTSNVVERWLGLGKVQVQTAAGSAQAEMTIEGLPSFEAVRDFLYARMRGAGEVGTHAASSASAAAAPRASGEAELAAVLREVAAEVRILREQLDVRAGEERRTDG